MTKVGIEMRLRLPDTETTINVDYLYGLCGTMMMRVQDIFSSLK